MASRAGCRSALVVSEMANSSLPASHATERNAQRQFGREHVDAEADLGSLQPGEFLEVARQVAGLREDPGGMIDHELPRLSGLEDFGGPIDQLGTECGFQRLDVLQEPGRRQAERLRDLGDVPRREEGDKVQETGGFHAAADASRCGRGWHVRKTGNDGRAASALVRCAQRHMIAG
jgi:hypothetical protein